MPENRIRVILVEDNPDYRRVVELALEGEPAIELVESFGTAEIALRSISAGRFLPPDVILLDLRLPGAGGLESIPEFRGAAPDSRILVLTQSDRESDVLRAISAGAAGYLLKSSTVDEIVSAIRSVLVGGASFDPQVARYLLDQLKDRLPSGDAGGLLSKREQQVLELLADGKAKKEIAAELELGYGTVDTHLRHIYEKLQVSNAAAAISKAHRQGLLK